MKKKILVIDDDPILGKLVEETLKPLNILLFQAFSGKDGIKMGYEIHPDLVILDIMMPTMDGFTVCERLREMSSVPILMLTARGNENDILQGFRLGVDDFVRKPFNGKELEARVRALLRRQNHSNNDPAYVSAYADARLEIDVTKKIVKVNGELVQLSQREFQLLSCLVREAGNPVTHRELVREVWGEDYLDAASLTSLYVHYLRKKLQDGKNGHHYLQTWWGKGYWFEPLKDE